MTGATAPAGRGALELRDAVVRRGDFEVRLDLRVDPGEVLALTGPNGTGKSSLLAALAGTLPLASGSLSLGGEVLDGVAAWVPPERRGVGLVPQQHLLFGHLSAVENVAYGLRARGVRRRVARAEAAGWLDRLGLSDRAHLRADALSGGQSQRVAIARALAAHPAYVLLDEPFAALDVGVRADVRALVADALRELAVPAVLVTHDEADVDALATRAVALG
ncbi:ABC transporter ATP-binding protein [Litorihabitans aurantiacus]|uniref:ABC transporter domain-containing protein n=1 Tax=Litorihabitans aurantiacus TaxID=1930061 RepID=A0AA37XGZ4_9MICO|nr:ATP-binding cassette domain-containing protein [Litorihabitans aurantiacus]GMA33331.1 hypothetical protein GCM10025875_33230 [Litorihabitans aurantiacus]